MRRDAKERRVTLLAAASRCFEEFGFDVPLDVIADRAGVGRATLYRNFPDRTALALAVFERGLDELVRSWPDDATLYEILGSMARERARAGALIFRLASELALTPENRAAFHRLLGRMVEALRPRVDEARRAGTLRQDVTAEQMFTASRMVAGAIVPGAPPDDVDDQVTVALDLLFQGLRPAPLPARSGRSDQPRPSAFCTAT